MNLLPEDAPTCAKSAAKKLVRFAESYFAGGLIIGVFFEFSRPDLTEQHEVQVFASPGFQPFAHSELMKQFEEGRVCMGGSLMVSIDVPTSPFTFPAYKNALTRIAKYHIDNYLGLFKSIARLTPEEQAEVHAELEVFIEAAR